MDSIKVLVLDDSQEFTFLLTSLLKFHNIEVVPESSALKAVENVQENAYSVIISDHMMDEMDGLTFIDKAKASALNKDTKFILLTAKKITDDEQSKVNKLGVSYVNKPILPNDLFKKIMDLLET